MRVQCRQHLVAEKLLYQPGTCLLDWKERRETLCCIWRVEPAVSIATYSTNYSDRQRRSGCARLPRSMQTTDPVRQYRPTAGSVGAQLRPIDLGRRPTL